jgi:ankyrin repeat protein
MKRKPVETGSTEAHIHARDANLEELRRVVEVSEEVVNAQDQNGWTPLHEAVRSKDIEIVRFLLENGADVNLRTIEKDGKGGAALYLARRYVDEDDPLITLLLSYGAKHYVPYKEEVAPLQEQEL